MCDEFDVSCATAHCRRRSPRAPALFEIRELCKQRLFCFGVFWLLRIRGRDRRRLRAGDGTERPRLLRLDGR